MVQLLESCMAVPPKIKTPVWPKGGFVFFNIYQDVNREGQGLKELKVKALGGEIFAHHVHSTIIHTQAIKVTNVH